MSYYGEWSPVLAPRDSHGYEVLATSFSHLCIQRMGGQTSLSLSDLLADSVQSMFSVQVSWWGVEDK